MKVLVTGAGGFVGRHLVDALLRGTGLADGTPAERLVHLDHAPPSSHDPRIVSVVGDLADPDCRAKALDGGADCIFHLAAVPGGAAEANPAASERVNVDATLALAGEAAALGARFVYASTIAVLGTPEGSVDDETEPRPAIVYGRHKLHVERALADLVASGDLKASAVRLPGLVARPLGGTGLKSAFLSDIFHRLAARETFLCPVSPEATVWLMSVETAAANLIHAALPDVIARLEGRAVTLPALRTSMATLASTIGAVCGVPSNVVYQPDEALEAHFGRLPPLTTDRARNAGFRDDGTLEHLVASALGLSSPGLHSDHAPRVRPSALRM